MVIGIDADSKRLAYCALDSGAIRAVGTIERANQAGRIEGRYDSALTAFMRRASEMGAVVYLEGIFLPERQGQSTPRNVLAFERLAEVHGEIKRAARLCAVPVEDVNPSVWHSAILGFSRGREELKAAAMAKARTLTGRDDLTEHEADAVCIALHGAGSGAGFARAAKAANG